MGGWKETTSTKSCGNNDNHLACLEVLKQKEAQENKGGRVCELLSLFPACQWGSGWHEQVFKFPEVGVFMGPSDKEPKRVRTCEQQVENYQDLVNPACNLSHFTEVRVAQVHFPTLRSFEAQLL